MAYYMPRFGVCQTLFLFSEKFAASVFARADPFRLDNFSRPWYGAIEFARSYAPINGRETGLPGRDVCPGAAADWLCASAGQDYVPQMLFLSRGAVIRQGRR
jgi:hypothetical protein